MQMSYGFPERELPEGLFASSDKTRASSRRGTQVFYHVGPEGHRVENAAYAFTEVPEGRPDTGGYVFLDFHSMQAWYEEDEELIGHPRDPFTRIDVRRGSAHIRVTAGGVTVADSPRPKLLLETGLPTRYYIPYEDVAWEHLVRSETTTVCPYKGRSKYWSVHAGDAVYPDVVWAYPFPLQDAEAVQGHLCFYQEKLELHLNGEKQFEPPRFFTK